MACRSDGYLAVYDAPAWITQPNQRHISRTLREQPSSLLIMQRTEEVFPRSYSAGDGKAVDFLWSVGGEHRGVRFKLFSSLETIAVQ